MSQLRPGLPPECVIGALSRPTALLIPLLCLALGACSTTGATGPAATSYYRAPVTGIDPQLRANAPPVEVEADGIEAQLPPRRRVHQIPDDPTQPYSPNYGSIPAEQDEQDEAAAPVPGSAPSWAPIVKPASIG